MPRARLLKPGFFKNELLAELSAYHRLCFAGLWTLADREGRLEDRPERIKAELFPYEKAVTVKAVDTMLHDLQSTGFILRYGVPPNANGAQGYIAVLTFLEHQTPHHREPPSRIRTPSSRQVKLARARQKKPRAEPRAGPRPA